MTHLGIRIKKGFMPANPRKLTQRSLLISVLVVGALLFALPYVNMVFTSVKMDEEMSSENFSILPRTPVPRTVSPYVMDDTGYAIKRPNGMSREDWERFKDPFTTAIRSAVDNWYGKEPLVQTAFGKVDRKAAVESLTQVLGAGVLTRISDSARKQGTAAMLAEVPKLATPEKVKDAFVEFMPRFCLGDVTVRLSDYSKRRAGTGANWSAASSNATAIPLAPPLLKPGETSTLLSYDSPNRDPVSATFAPAATVAATQGATSRPAGTLLPLGADEASKIDRVYVFVQSDQSWARIDIRLTVAGRVYRLDETIHAATRTWTQIEMRIPGQERMPTSGRTFYLLEDLGPAPEGAPQFAVDLTLHPNSGLGAWWAKITRNYAIAFRQVPIARYIGTSISLAILSIILTTFGSSLSAYAFARLDFPGKNVFFGLLLATMMIPGQVTMIPSFLIHKQLGWYNTLYPLWVHSAFGAAFYIFMLRQFFLSIPKELEDAARIDGCGFFGIYWYVMLPLVRPTLITVAIFSFMGSWNNFMGPLIYVNDERLYNLAFGLFKFNLTSGANSSLIMAGSFIMTVPIIAMFFFFQRYFIQGISISGLGGR
jgi:ABC-type glycerol-3-phosphate transport system permease component